jgi:hypothetical protein
MRIKVRTYLFKNNIFAYFIALTVGVGLLVFFYFQSFPRLSWSDEIVYAVVGRNIAEGRGIITNFYVPASIAEQGYPLGDVHVPGHMFFIVPFFWLIGPKEIAALLPNQISYLVTGLLLCWLGKRAFNRWAGMSAAIFFFLFPAIITYAHSAMAELTLVLLSTIYLVVWYRSLKSPRLIDSFLMAILLVAGAIHRQTFLTFLPLSVYVFFRWPLAQRKKGLLFFGGIFLVLMLFVFVPLYQARAPYPSGLANLFNVLSNLPDTTQRAQFFWQKALTNLSDFLWGSSFSQYLASWTFILLVIVCVFSWSPFSAYQKPLIIFFLFAFLTNFLAVSLLHTFLDWQGFRALSMFIPAGVLILSGFVAQRRKIIKFLSFVLLLGYFGYSAFHLNALLTLDRQQTYQTQHQQSQMIIEQTQEFQPQTVMANKAFLYGWEAYPVTVIWRVATDPAMAKALEEAIPIDVIVVGEEDKNRLIDGVRQGVFKGNYQLVNEIPLEGQYIFVNADRIQREEQ